MECWRRCKPVVARRAFFGEMKNRASLLKLKLMVELGEPIRTL